MREIKFRGKRSDDGNWAYGDLIHVQRVTMTGLEPAMRVSNDPVIEETIGQFTGLLDVNGKEIYEGDLIGYGHRNYKVEYRNGAFWLIGHNSVVAHQLCNTEIKEFEFEIVGNIHE